MSNSFSNKTNININWQQNNFNDLIAQLGKANAEEIERVLSKREIIEPEPELTPNIINRLKEKIKNQK
ncbi:hypothetical protein [Pleurocapsa sp. PCC 7319]|uniref:hypothetical protein n=1 Tax=Pleurocapsa sp. PCC 7319 TaxID=118161 RepID=UPI00034D3121|nr:hypothetical protein [Pleurocapsa sp. PCC 7319]